MPLPTPYLDDRRFQDIVDQAKRMITTFCPEWTDHNVSDPGVALIELFAWMTDLLLYRVNQVPDKVYIEFLKLIGVRLDPPRAARAPVTFYLSAPQSSEVTIPTETEVATVRTETSPAIIFTTETDLIVRPASITGVFTRNARQGGSGGWTVHDLRQLGLPGRRLPMFPTPPGPGDSFYIAFERDHSNHVLALIVDCDTAGGAGVDPRNPPLEWQAWQGGLARWTTCEVEFDGTGGFNQSGEIILHIPPMAQEEIQKTRAYWLRCRLTDAQAGPASYKVSPALERIAVESRGGTVSARHAETIQHEQIGISEGTPGESFKLLYTPVLARDPNRDYLIVETPGVEQQRWHEVADFADSNQDDQHYTLDGQDGTLTLGPALIQPDGTVYRFSQVPSQGSTLRFTRYQHGGGVMGNVPTGMLSVLKTSIPYVARVVNRATAVGGRDAQSLEDAMLRAPHLLRTRTRAVTADDYEHLAREVVGVARARCLAPGAQPGDPNDIQPGQVVVLVLPQADAANERIPPDRMTLSAELRGSVLSYLDERRVLGARLNVQTPQYIWVSVQAQLRVAERSEPALRIEVQRRAEADLYRYLNPYVGGPQGTGWPFGRALHQSEIYGLLQRIPGVEFVEDVQVSVNDPGDAAAPQAAPARLSVPLQGVICSNQHRVSVS